MDLAARPGEPVRAAVAGTVAFAGSVAGRGVVEHRPRSVPDHVRAGATRGSRAGQRVGLGETIGRVAAGGHCDGCLHWGLRRGETYLDPLLLIRPVRRGPLRLLAADQRGGRDRAGRASARRRPPPRPRRVSAGSATAFGTVGPGGGHGFGRPVPGAITSAFGMRFHPVLRRWKLHDGTDFGASCGTPIRAPYAGTVTSTYYSGATGTGCCSPTARVDGHAVTTGYNHATRYVVGPGDRVTRGQVLGYVGSTGYSTGCHLHLMVWLDGRLVDPMTWF